MIHGDVVHFLPLLADISVILFGTVGLVLLLLGAV